MTRSIDSKKTMIDFCKYHNIAPTKEESVLLELAILQGSIEQIKIEMEKLDNELKGN